MTSQTTKTNTMRTMELTAKHIGSYGGGPAKIIELTVSVGNSSITEEVTDLNHKVDQNFIVALRQLADELEEQNNLCV